MNRESAGLLLTGGGDDGGTGSGGINGGKAHVVEDPHYYYALANHDQHHHHEFTTQSLDQQQHHQQHRQQDQSIRNGSAMASSPLIPAMHFIPFPVNVGWFVHFVKEHIHEKDENLETARAVAIGLVADGTIAEVVAEDVEEICMEVEEQAVAKRAEHVFGAIADEVVSETVGVEANRLVRARNYDASSWRVHDMLLTEVCEELVTEAVAWAQQCARERAVDKVADELLSDVEDEFIFDACADAWDDAQPKNSFEMLSLAPNRTRKKPLR
ncbi:hypothetical protein PTSG_09384 [Salpingoeca rosetta]|uniref:Uncharacterized protein n=1 Tax=Salpingoeca rosetta (strain ATCC 50818 / BSB-021) TaxID=946362 RepID=F2UMG8_SALR5|nr:uncharacterized protein PTSG_09384 [Salpingoeca rosetta]EGD78317.1 hypothetical protein PTSG_09384 [Salpingoeca rosetta]|eukprot:XP_004989640.1 hypothetical protein PTSG_09384 [Salpingoeca rosetta]